jgi:peptidoglycan/LPS O-acetylase OafA/YrhL
MAIRRWVAETCGAGPVPLSRAMAERTNARLAYVPALDGVRAVAVLMVLCFHAGFTWMGGGFLGVSTFFTLSGFLITSLLLAEHDQHGRVSLTTFWSRRYRRLLPASLAGLAFVVVLVSTGALPTSPRLPGDILASLAQVANWRFLMSGHSYAELFASPSPVLHYWSLAIEEQFYVLFPLLVVAVLRRRAAVLGSVIGTLTLASVTTAVVLGLTGHPEATYYATPARVAELTIGSLLALAVRRRPEPSARTTRILLVAGPAALVATVGLGVVTSLSDRWLQLGGLPAFALVSATLVAGARAGGPLAALLSTRPLVAIGRVSYGVYVFHWPIFLWLDAERTGLAPWPLFGLRLVVTAAVAVPMYLLVESPVRAGGLRGWAPAGALAGMAVVVVGAAAMPTSSASAALIDFSAARAQLATVDEVAATPTTIAPPPDQSTAPPAPRKLRVAAYGDSTGLMTSLGVGAWGNQDGRLVLNADGTQLGCSIGVDGRRRYGPFPAEDVPERCRDWRHIWADLAERTRADVALVMAGPFDVTDRQLPGDTVWRAPGDPVYDAYLHQQLLDVIDLFHGLGVQVAFVASPHIELGAADVPPPAKPYPVSDPARMDRWNALVREAAAERPGTVVLDLPAHLASLPGGEMDPRLRPDGVHFTLDTTREVGGWLGPQLLEAMQGKVDLFADGRPALSTPGVTTDQEP